MATAQQPTPALPQQHGLIFLPFLRTNRTYTVAGVTFLPLRDEHGVVPNLLQPAVAALDRILSGYVNRNGQQFDNCVVATRAGRGWELGRSDYGDVAWAASLLFLASAASNEYFARFGGPYVNSTMFRVVGQSFSGDLPTYISIPARRRDGSSTDGGYRHGEATFNLPIQCSINLTATVDEALLTALDAATTAGSPIVDRLRTSMPFVQLANTDDDSMMPRAEAILMGSAFEQLLKGDSSAYTLSRRMGELFLDFGSVTVANAQASRNHIQIEASAADHPAWRTWKYLRRWFPEGRARWVDDHLARWAKASQLKWWVHRKWIEELYDVRSKIVHRGTHAGRTWGWNLFEHLVIAAFTFPLSVKLLLAKNGHYQLSDDDRIRCRALDKLLSSTKWVENHDVADDEESWTAITSKIRQDLSWERAWEAVRAQYPDMFDNA